MGDVLTLIEKAEAVVDKKEADKLAKKLRQSEFTLEDFLDQIQQIKKMGSLEQILDMVPGINKLRQLKDAPKPDEKELFKTEAIIRSMTREERQNHKIINTSRRERIADRLGNGHGRCQPGPEKLFGNVEDDEENARQTRRHDRPETPQITERSEKIDSSWT